MGEVQSLAPLPQQTLAGWHAFVATGNQDLLAPLLSEHIVFRSPFVQSPIPGRTATLLVLTTVVQIFENFRYHREFVAGSHDAALEFSANIGKWQLKGIDLIKFDDAGQNDRIRGDGQADQGVAGAGRGNGEPDRPGIDPAEAGRGGSALIARLYDGRAGHPALARALALWQGSARRVEAFFGRFLSLAHAAVAQW